MGLFRSKGKGNSDHLPVEPPGDYSATALQNGSDPNFSRNDISKIPPVPPNQFNSDSGYSGSYPNSNVSSNLSNADNRSNTKPRTTIVTTTTTTTTTTTVDSDGSTNTQVHPYDPSTDPAPASETTITSSAQPSTNETPNNVTEYSAVRRNSTSGGRAIPPRSQLRNSQNVLPQSPSQAQIHSENLPQSEYQPQPQYQLSPLGSHPMAPPPVSPAASFNGTHSNQSNQAAYQNQPSDQGPQGSTRSSQTAGSSAYLNQPATHAPPSKREGLMAGMRALHGAGDALRGTVNSKIAGRLGDDQDAARQRAIRERGLGEVREAGLRERLPLVTGGGKLRKRSLSRGLADDSRRPLERVDESRVDF